MLSISEVERVGSCSRFCSRCCSLSHWQQHPRYKTVKHILESPPFTGMNARGECNHLQWVGGMASCSIYETRPEICRTFPNHPLSVETIPECSYAFRAKA